MRITYAFVKRSRRHLASHIWIYMSLLYMWILLHIHMYTPESALYNFCSRTKFHLKLIVQVQVQRNIIMPHTHPCSDCCIRRGLGFASDSWRPRDSRVGLRGAPQNYNKLLFLFVWFLCRFFRRFSQSLPLSSSSAVVGSCQLNVVSGFQSLWLAICLRFCRETGSSWYMNGSALWGCLVQHLSMDLRWSDRLVIYLARDWISGSSLTANRLCLKNIETIAELMALSSLYVLIRFNNSTLGSKDAGNVPVKWSTSCHWKFLATRFQVEPARSSRQLQVCYQQSPAGFCQAIWKAKWRRQQQQRQQEQLQQELQHWQLATL